MRCSCGGPVFLTRRRHLVTLANRLGLPASYVTRDYPEVGRADELWSEPDRRPIAGPAFTPAAFSRVRNPPTLPVDQATRFDLVINLATAKALDLEVPAPLLARADEVIE